MGFGPKDGIDQALIKKYSRMQVDNPGLVKNIAPEKILDAMNDYAMMKKNILNFNFKVQNIYANTKSKKAVFQGGNLFANC